MADVHRRGNPLDEIEGCGTNHQMFEAAKLYCVAETRTSRRIAICRVEDLAAMLNANRIREEYAVKEWTGVSSKLINETDTGWLTIAELLREAYINKPLVTVFVQDVDTNAFIISERYRSDDGPAQVALGALELFFDQHHNELTKTPSKKFRVYFKSESNTPMVIDVTLQIGNRTVYKGVTGSKHAPIEEVHHYTYDQSIPRGVEPPDVFPAVSLDMKPPKYDPTAYLSPLR